MQIGEALPVVQGAGVSGAAVLFKKLELHLARSLPFAAERIGRDPIPRQDLVDVGNRERTRNPEPKIAILRYLKTLVEVARDIQTSAAKQNGGSKQMGAPGINMPRDIAAQIFFSRRRRFPDEVALAVNAHHLGMHQPDLGTLIERVHSTLQPVVEPN